MTFSRAHFVLLAGAVLAGPATSARAQSFGLDLEAGYATLTASRSAYVVFGSSGGFTVGGSAQYAFKKGIFVRGGYRHFGKNGEKVFLADANSPAFPLGFPLTVSINSVDVLGGWRFKLGAKNKKKKPSPFVPYLAAGLVISSYHEESTVADLVEKNDQTKPGFQFLGGIEWKAFRKFTLAAEAAYAIVPNAIGVGGVSKIYGEDDIGGFRVMGRLGYRFH
jgi:opacity protein-like surface antigen